MDFLMGTWMPHPSFWFRNRTEQNITGVLLYQSKIRLPLTFCCLLSFSPTAFQYSPNGYTNYTTQTTIPTTFTSQATVDPAAYTITEAGQQQAAIKTTDEIDLGKLSEGEVKNITHSIPPPQFNYETEV